MACILPCYLSIEQFRTYTCVYKICIKICIYVCLYECVHICVYTYTDTHPPRERDFVINFKKGGIDTLFSLIQSMQLLYSSLKYMQIKFYKESNQIEAALFSSIAIYKRTHSWDSYSICSPSRKNTQTFYCSSEKNIPFKMKIV